jgi:hypothetical protein
LCAAPTKRQAKEASLRSARAAQAAEEEKIWASLHEKHTENPPMSEELQAKFSQGCDDLQGLRQERHEVSALHYRQAVMGEILRVPLEGTIYRLKIDVVWNFPADSQLHLHLFDSDGDLHGDIIGDSLLCSRGADLPGEQVSLHIDVFETPLTFLSRAGDELSVHLKTSAAGKIIKLSVVVVRDTVEVADRSLAQRALERPSDASFKNARYIECHMCGDHFQTGRFAQASGYVSRKTGHYQTCRLLRNKRETRAREQALARQMPQYAAMEAADAICNKCVDSLNEAKKPNELAHEDNVARVAQCETALGVAMQNLAWVRCNCGDHILPAH